MVRVVLWYRLQLWTVVRVDVRALVRVRSWYRVTWVNIVESHITVLLLRMSDCSVHCFDRELWIELAAGCRSLWWAFHEIIVFVHDHLVAWSLARHCWSLHSSDSVPPLHHFVENFLLCWICVCLIFFTYRCSSIPGVISNTKKICSCVVPTIRFWLKLSSVRRGHVTTCFRVRLHRLHLLDVETRRLRRLSWNRMVLECMLPDVCTSAFLRLITYIVIQKRHMFCERLLIINISVRTAKLIWRTHMYLTIHISMLVRWFVRISILLLLVWEKLRSQRLYSTLHTVELTAPVHRIFGTEATLSHIEILIFQLLNSSFKGPIFISELYQFCVNFIHCRHFWLDVFDMTTWSEFSIFGIALFHDALNLGRNKLIVILAIILKNTFD